ncbi:DUF2889 domain-containing protein [Sphingobium sp. EM0848]|uniref:DUF2889 domain-containing protein n=1 Tax=Sphingobium sp. EM0848 TaxID=2743473 RepID=UPI00159CA106|nr:DUF2889 domain-containing protein [Sphingobium sp. EM0848]
MSAPTLSLRGEPLPEFAVAPRQPAGPSPVRRPGSVRRTSTLYVDWPDGRGGRAFLHGRARDILTPVSGGVPIALAEDAMEAQAESRVICSVAADPPRTGLEALVGARAGGHLRQAIDDVLHEERVAGSPLYLLLDDMAGTTLIAGWAWTQWRDEGVIAEQRAHRHERVPQMASVCIGFRPGSSALDLSRAEDISPTLVPPMERADDPAGWHDFPVLQGPNLRRARRIDVWREAGQVQIDATFQDSGALPEGGRSGLHEYRIRAVADRAGEKLLSIEAIPQILPFPECPAATVNLYTLLDTPLVEMRMTVLSMLRKTAGCTHLNDALRALAEVPRLVSMLPAEI